MTVTGQSYCWVLGFRARLRLRLRRLELIRPLAPATSTWCSTPSHVVRRLRWAIRSRWMRTGASDTRWMCKEGSSGSPIFSVADNKVVGINYKQSLVGDPPLPACPNFGVKISWLLANPGPGQRVVTAIQAVDTNPPAALTVLTANESRKRITCPTQPARECPETTEAIPTVSEWGLATLAMLVLAAGTVVLRRSRRVAA